MTYEQPSRYTATNPTTGDLIKSRTDGQDKYSEGWDKIFSKKPVPIVRKFKVGDKVKYIYSGEIFTVLEVDYSDTNRPYSLGQSCGDWYWESELELVIDNLKEDENEEDV